MEFTSRHQGLRLPPEDISPTAIDTDSFPDDDSLPTPEVPISHVARDIIETIVLTLLAFWLAQSVVQGFRVTGPSMTPTLLDGHFLFVNKLNYVLEDPDRGDIIVFWPPYESEDRLIKRIIGVAGDEIEVQDGQVFVNGLILDEPYISSPPSYSGEWTVPEGSFFVLGDNRNSSYDGHNWTSFLPRDNIIGKAAVIYWPIPNWGKAPHVPIMADN